MKNKEKLINFLDSRLSSSIWTVKTIAQQIFRKETNASLKSTQRLISTSPLYFPIIDYKHLQDEHKRPAKKIVLQHILQKARKQRKLILFAHYNKGLTKEDLLMVNDARGTRRWIKVSSKKNKIEALEQALVILAKFEKKHIILIPSGELVKPLRNLVKKKCKQKCVDLIDASLNISLEIYSHGHAEITNQISYPHQPSNSSTLTHLDRLEAESIHIIREAMVEAENPVMLYSVGKDSSVMLHLARKAFFPSLPPFPLLHIDTQWKFQAMYDFRDYIADQYKMDLLVHINPDGIKRNINPFIHGSELHTNIMKTQSLKMALSHYKFDLAFGGARRDEEKSRAKERIFSFRTNSNRWNPKKQRPELWNVYNGKKNPNETIRVFPISNWTELDIWQYIYQEHIPIVPLYFAAERPVVERNKMLLMIDDDRITLNSKENIQLKKIRFRTLGCYPLTGAILSDADNIPDIIVEILNSKTSERQGRIIDIDANSSMEKKKHEGYF